MPDNPLRRVEPDDGTHDHPPPAIVISGDHLVVARGGIAFRTAHRNAVLTHFLQPDGAEITYNIRDEIGLRV